MELTASLIQHVSGGMPFKIRAYDKDNTELHRCSGNKNDAYDGILIHCKGNA